MDWSDEFGLGERLLALDAEVVALRGELARRDRAAVATAVATADWPLRDPARDPATLSAYERRPDDGALLAARAGDAFLLALKECGLHAAAAALAGHGSRLAPGATPAVSVVIPVHGQLAWTLNCLDALLRHDSRRGFEIVIVDDASVDDTAAVLGDLARSRADLRLLSLPRNAGFVAACNAGAAAARGGLLVLLNNDTRVAEGWLDALADSFALFPDAGLVGSKLLYPDGTLQEAGAILWRDGSAWNCGRGEDPNQPAYCHARQVDYVSGASIAVPAGLWRALGGLDAMFAPAYGEDADLALRVRAAGREVWFQPTSRVIHYEGRTGGTDTAAGTKAHQVVNLKKLFVRWHATLAAHGRPGGNAAAERERGVRRRALVVEATTPTPRQDAGSGVATETIRLLIRLGYAVQFAPQDNMLFDAHHTAALQREGVACAYAPYDSGFDAFIARHGATLDAVVVFRPGVFAATEAALRRHAPHAALVFSNADLHFLRLERQAALAGDIVSPDIRARELALIARAPVTLTLSSVERDVLVREAPGARVMLQPYPHAVIGTSAGFRARRHFLFLGGYAHPPNVDAATHLVRVVLPLVLEALPGARVVLAGANPTAAILALAGPRVTVTGALDDLAPAFDAARVFVAPLRAGAGVKGKIIAALAHGLPVVTSSVGAEGIGAQMRVEDDPAAFARACVALHQDAAAWRRLSAAGLDYVGTNCSAAAGAAALSAAIDAALTRQLGLEAI